MPQPVSGQVGVQTLGDGSPLGPIRQGRSGEVVVTELHGKYYEQVYRGNVWLAASQAALAFPAGFAPTAPVYTLYNPPGSGVNLALLHAALQLSAAPAAATTFAIVGSPVAAAPTTTTAITTRNALFGTNPGAAKGQVYSVATIVAGAIVLRVLGGGVVAATAITATQVNDDISSGLIVVQGYSISIASLTAASAFCHLLWEEVPV